MGIQTLAPLETATVKVQYVNMPKEGKKKGSIKDTEGDYYGVWADKLHDFQAGETYEITFRENNGYRDVVAVKRAPTKPAEERPYTVVETANPRPATAHASQYYRPTSPKDARRMWLCSQMNALISSRQCPISVEAIAEATRILMEAYDQTIGSEE